MNYLTLVDQLAIRTWLDKDSVKRFFESLADILVQLEEGEWVKTPIGTFRAYARPHKRVKLACGKWVVAKPQLQIRLRPGKILKRNLPDDYQKKAKRKKGSARQSLS